MADIVSGLRQSRRYRSVSEPTLLRVARWSLRSGQGRQAALKAAKRKLHQVYGAYLGPGAIVTAERAATRLSEGGLDAKNVDLAIEGTGPASKQAGQHVRVTVTTKGG